MRVYLEVYLLLFSVIGAFGEMRVIVAKNSDNSLIGIKVEKGFIKEISSLEEKKELTKGENQILDFSCCYIYPGFIDAHAHLISLGKSLLSPNLSKTKSWEEVIDILRDTLPSYRKGQWVVLRGWHQDKWDRKEGFVAGMPTNRLLNEVSPYNPVILIHASGHAVIVNNLALDRSGITRNPKLAKSGEIVRYKNGEPTGVLLEKAAEKVLNIYEKSITAEEKIRWIKLAQEHALSRGVTFVHDAGVSVEEAKIFIEMAQSGELKIRVYLMLHDHHEKLEKFLSKLNSRVFGDLILIIGGIKAFADGALGSRGALLLEPYSDAPDTTGFRVDSLDKLNKLAKLAKRFNLQLAIHAIGDRAVREVLDLYEKYKVGNLRWRIEHAQHIDRSDLPRFAQLGIIASMQPIHAVSDAPWVPKRLGKRTCKISYIWNSLYKSGAKLAFGTDAPVEAIDPLQNLYAAISRKTKNGKPFCEQEKIPLNVALHSYTVGSSYAAKTEKIIGEIEIGKKADFVILSSPLSPKKILKTKVLATIVNGQVLYKR